MNSILLSFDLEEFDIPEEFGQKLSDEEKLRVTNEGLKPLLTLLDKYNTTATFYTTAFFAERNEALIKTISENHEIASHGYYHSSFKPEDIATSKQVLERITGKKVNGYRMARLQPFDISLLEKAGYLYDSSLNPTFLPGRYNNLSKPKLPFKQHNIWVLPTSVAAFRIPLFWISFKNFPQGFYTSLAKGVLNKSHYLNLYFHPWEFADISGYKLPNYVKRISGNALLAKFEKLLIELKENGNYITAIEYCKTVLSNAH